MQTETKTVEEVEIEKQRGIEKAHKDQSPTTKVEKASSQAEQERIKTAKKIAKKDDK